MAYGNANVLLSRHVQCRCHGRFGGVDGGKAYSNGRDGKVQEGHKGYSPAILSIHAARHGFVLCKHRIHLKCEEHVRRDGVFKVWSNYNMGETKAGKQTLVTCCIR